MNAVTILLSVVEKVKVYQVGVERETGRMVREAAVPLSEIKKAINSAVIEEEERLNNVEEAHIVT